MKKMEKTGLPEAFVEKMNRLLGEEAGSFFESYERDRSFGLRINPLKAGERLPESLEGLERIPWSQEGLYYPEELRPGKEPAPRGRTLLYPGAQRTGVCGGAGPEDGRADPGPLRSTGRKEHPPGGQDGAEGPSGVQ